MNTKILVAAAVLASAIASATLAQSAPRTDIHGFPSQLDEGGDIRAPHSTKRSYDLYYNGHYVGSTPDPNIRLQLQRELDGGER
jgi:hypothetical protein